MCPKYSILEHQKNVWNIWGIVSDFGGIVIPDPHAPYVRGTFCCKPICNQRRHGQNSIEKVEKCGSWDSEK